MTKVLGVKDKRETEARGILSWHKSSILPCVNVLTSVLNPANK